MTTNTLGIARIRQVFAHDPNFHLVYFFCGCDALHHGNSGELDVLTRDWCALRHWGDQSLPFRGFNDDDAIRRKEERDSAAGAHGADARARPDRVPPTRAH